MNVKKLFRFRLRSLLALMFVIAIPFGYYAWNAKHYTAIATLLQEGSRIQWQREKPSWLDEQLGIYRFDAVKRVDMGWSSDLRALADLNSLEEFNSDHMYVEFSPLLGHADSLKVFGMFDIPKEAAELLIETRNLEECAGNTWAGFDLNWIAKNKNLKALYVTDVCGGLEHLASFTDLEYLQAPRELESLEAVRNMTKLKHLEFSGSKVRSLEPIKGLTSFKVIGFDDCPIPQDEIDAFLESLPEGVSAYGSSYGAEQAND